MIDDTPAGDALSTQPADLIKARVAVMTAGGTNPALVINALARRFCDVTVILEEQERKSEILKRRAKRLGFIHAAGQLATMAAAKVLRRLVSRRVESLLATTGLPAEIAPGLPVIPVASINAQESRDALARFDPAVVVLVSTRLMSRDMLAAIRCPVINLHAGLNPGYRGQMGGYWALAEGKPEAFAATVHLVDAGTDTGDTLYVSHAMPDRADNIATYPLVLTISALDNVVKAAEDAVAGRLTPYAAEGPSMLRFPPTTWRWLVIGLFRGIW